ncbi:MAG: ABC transporter permease, partial [Saprospiraceae bacterium]
MFNNYLKIAFRNLWKQRVFSLINVMGLAIGMACCFLIVQYVQHEKSYDQFHANLDRLYRINYQAIFAGNITLAKIPPAFAPQAALEFPELEHIARMYPRDVSATVPETDKQLEIEGIYCADSTITRVFQFDYLHGDASALDRPFSVILSEETALNLFDKTEVLGRSLRLAENGNFKVTAVIKDWPEQAHLELKLLIPYQNMVDLEPPHAQDRLQQVLANNMTATHSYTYALLKEHQSVEAVNAKFAPFIPKHGPENLRDKQDFALFPVKDIHIKSEASLEQKPPVDTNVLYTFMGIGLITLLIACINFINLTTASSLNRIKEVGVRKVLGARKTSLMAQFLGESLLLSLFAFLLSLPIAALALPKLNSLTNLDLAFAPWNNLPLLGAFIGIFIVAGLLAGSYPAFFVSRFETINSLKGSTGRAQKTAGVGLRKGLITLQFLATIIFISGAAITYLQLEYLRNQPLGFDQELTLLVPIDSGNNINAAFRAGDATIRQRMNTVDDILLNHPNIKAVTQCDRPPGFGAIGHPVHNEHVLPSDAYTTHLNSVDYDYAEAFGLEVIAGREFDPSYGTDHLNKFVINEQAVKELGWENPEAAIGQPLTAAGSEGQVLGVLKD